MQQFVFFLFVFHLPLASGTASASSRGEVAVTFQGNGNMAMTCYSGILIGLMRAADGQQDIGDLLARFGTVATTSGGSWFFAALVYGTSIGLRGGSFKGFLESVGQDASADLTSEWAKWAPKSNPFRISALTNWNDLNAAVGRDALGIHRGARLGQTVPEWASGKLWLATTTMFGPESNQYPLVGRTSVRTEGSRRMTLTPAKFSIRLNQESSARAPLPFCATEACFDYNVAYIPSGWDWWWRRTTFKIGDGAEKAFRDQPGNLDLIGVLTATSAAFAQSFLPLGHTGSGQWASLAQDSKNTLLRAPPNRWSSRPGYMASRGHLPLMDGAFTTNTGIPHTIAAGATEVVSFINDVPNTLKGTDELRQFFGNGGSSTLGSTSDQIFEKQELGTYKALQASGGIPDHTLRLLSMDAVTIDNDAYNIKAGRQVKLHVFSVVTHHEVFTNYNLLPGLVQEIVAAMGNPANKDTSREMLNIMLGN